MTNQKLVLEQITALNTTTADMIDSTGEMLRTQTGAIHEQAASSTIPLETLQRAFQNIYDTMDQIDRFKLEALGNMKQTVDTLGKRSREVEGLYRPRRRRGPGQASRAAPRRSRPSKQNDADSAPIKWNGPSPASTASPAAGRARGPVARRRAARAAAAERGPLAGRSVGSASAIGARQPGDDRRRTDRADRDVRLPCRGRPRDRHRRRCSRSCRRPSDTAAAAGRRPAQRRNGRSASIPISTASAPRSARAGAGRGRRLSARCCRRSSRRWSGSRRSTRMRRTRGG